jgi:hypothetical protein
MQVQRPQNLHFLAAHHVGRAGAVDAFQARHDGKSTPIMRETQRSGGERFGTSRTAQIRHFLPAHGGADHAAQQCRQFAVRPTSISGVPGRNRGGKAGGVTRHRGALTFAPRQHMAGCITQIQPQAAGAPVTGNEGRFAHGRFLYTRPNLV